MEFIIIIFKNHYFRIIKNFTKCNILNTFAFKAYGKFDEHNLEKLCSWSLALASTIPVLGFKRVCLRKVGPWPRIFLVLGLACSRVVSLTALLLIFSDYALIF